MDDLRNRLFYEQKNAYDLIDTAERIDAEKYCRAYMRYLNDSRTEREAVDNAILLAEKSGFVPYVPGMELKPGDKIYQNNRGKALMLAVMGRQPLSAGAVIAGAHVDAPRLDLKQTTLYESDEMAFFKTHYYGGIKKYQWTTIPLALHGRVVKLDGTCVDIHIGDDPKDECFLITDLLPHLDKEQATKTMAKAFTGEDLNILIGSRPYDNSDEKDLIALNIMHILNERYGIEESDFLSAELNFCPAYPTRDIGFDRSMIGGYGHDDKCCAYPSVTAILDTELPECTCITYLTDKEEIGSEGNTGMQSDFLRYFIYDLAKQDGNEGYHVLSKSKCLSADVTSSSASTPVTAASTTPPTLPLSSWARSAPCSSETTSSGRSASWARSTSAAAAPSPSTSPT